MVDDDSQVFHLEFPLHIVFIDLWMPYRVQMKSAFYKKGDGDFPFPRFYAVLFEFFILRYVGPLELPDHVFTTSCPILTFT